METDSDAAAFSRQFKVEPENFLGESDEGEFSLLVDDNAEDVLIDQHSVC
jgi:hypothetical protein